MTGSWFCPFIFFCRGCFIVVQSSTWGVLSMISVSSANRYAESAPRWWVPLSVSEKSKTLFSSVSSSCPPPYRDSLRTARSFSQPVRTYLVLMVSYFGIPCKQMREYSWFRWQTSCRRWLFSYRKAEDVVNKYNRELAEWKRKVKESRRSAEKERYAPPAKESVRDQLRRLQAEGRQQKPKHRSRDRER